MGKIIAIGFAGLLFVVSVIGLAFGYHDTLNVTVNGMRLSPAEIAALEQIIHMPVVSGRYWYNPFTGLWGREGQPAQGRINLNGQGNQEKSYNGWNRNTPGGNWGGGGTCSYYFDPDSGSSWMSDRC